MCCARAPEAPPYPTSYPTSRAVANSAAASPLRYSPGGGKGGPREGDIPNATRERAPEKPYRVTIREVMDEKLHRGPENPA